MYLGLDAAHERCERGHVANHRPRIQPRRRPQVRHLGGELEEVFLLAREHGLDENVQQRTQRLPVGRVSGRGSRRKSKKVVHREPRLRALVPDRALVPFAHEYGHFSKVLDDARQPPAFRDLPCRGAQHGHVSCDSRLVLFKLVSPQSRCRRNLARGPRSPPKDFSPGHEGHPRLGVDEAVVDQVGFDLERGQRRALPRSRQSLGQVSEVASREPLV
mmetsp:Transcript_9768/g.22331  ORF Transcript_9768/g.22331 Transcript_9768/m.22331 type:complete len:217 (-) Transcript_9768:591-1241(-)